MSLTQRLGKRGRFEIASLGLTIRDQRISFEMEAIIRIAGRLFTKASTSQIDQELTVPFRA